MLVRPVLLMSVLFAAGIYFCTLGIGIFWIIIMTALLCIGGVLLYRDKRWLCVGISLFMVLGFGRMELAQGRKESLSAIYGGSTFQGQVTVTDFSDRGRAEAFFKDNGKRVKIYLKTNSNAMLYPGDILWGSFALSEYSPSKTSLFDFSSYMHSEGIYLSAEAERFQWGGRMTKGIEGFIYKIRTHMDRLGEKAFSGDSRGLFNAMVFGDKRLLSDELDDALQKSGLSHIAVVSGMHISAVVVAMVFFLRKIFGKKRYVNILVLFGALFIAHITGMGASVIRALIMCVIYHLSKILYRDNDTYTTISASALIMLAVNPYYLANVGFILSLLCVLGIVLYTDKIKAAIEGILPEWASTAVAVSVAAQIIIMPVLIANFRTVNPYSIISNILIFPVSSLFVVMGLLYFLTVKISFVSAFLQIALQKLADIIEAVCLGVSKVPGAGLETGRIGIFFAISWVFILIAIHIYPARSGALKCLCVGWLLAMCIAVTFNHGEKLDMRFAHYGSDTFSALNIKGSGLIYIDCPDYYDALELKENFDEEVKCLIISALPTDGVFSLLESKLPQMVIASDALLTNEEKLELERAASSKGIRTLFLKDTERISVDGAWIEYFPIKNLRGRAVRVEYEDCVFVSLQGIVAKDTQKLLESGVTIKCDYLKIPYRITRKGAEFSSLTGGRVLFREKQFTVR
ncbi:MAG: ComEC/Rec2 family competence protein [Clostridia bacterium]|nr:ComEC/Rec2 family competence protein [Clostridia bacterium]